MKKIAKKNETARFCGNCDGHNSYDYPNKVFCSTRHAQSLNPIMDTLWCCNQWNLISQDCYCVREAKKQNKGTVSDKTKKLT